MLNKNSDISNDIENCNSDIICNEILDVEITINEVYNVVKISKCGKSLGVDNIPVKLYINTTALNALIRVFKIYYNKKKRTNPDFVAIEKEQNQRRRTNSKFVEFEKEQNKNRWSIPEFVAIIQEENNKRSDPIFKAFEHDIGRDCNSSINKALDSHQLIDAFQNEVSTACI
ncbi:unnamed protein product [Mytilus edulis]|uniref:Uncharacterized protein n=1 Tax=Mytilus edulis TaxID=6550 RepID=A0A8S3UTS3_MYTED|nr:unnamed protein product [Mytilus edulis]